LYNHHTTTHTHHTAARSHQTNDGTIHMMYTYLRETIKYKSFNASWISGDGERF
jgi:predicted neuraminidase